VNCGCCCARTGSALVPHRTPPHNNAPMENLPKPNGNIDPHNTEKDDQLPVKPEPEDF